MEGVCYSTSVCPEARLSPCRWCSKLCSDRVGKGWIGTGRDRIAIGRFLAGNCKTGRNSREDDPALVGLANRRLRPLGHLTARLQVYATKRLTGKRSIGKCCRRPPLKPSPLALNATTSVRCTVGAFSFWAHWFGTFLGTLGAFFNRSVEKSERKRAEATVSLTVAFSAENGLLSSIAHRVTDARSGTVLVLRLAARAMITSRTIVPTI